MKKINLAITGCMGRMGRQLIKTSKANKIYKHIFMKKISLFLISLSLLIVSNNTFRWYQNSENNVFQFGDWLMNYQGGFVRRGFFGEIFFRIYEITNISPPLIILIFLIFLYL